MFYCVYNTGQLVIFGGMNDQKDFNDVNILQTRAALKHLPPEMTGIFGQICLLLQDLGLRAVPFSRLSLLSLMNALLCTQTCSDLLPCSSFFVTYLLYGQCILFQYLSGDKKTTLSIHNRYMKVRCLNFRVEHHRLM